MATKARLVIIMQNEDPAAATHPRAMRTLIPRAVAYALTMLVVRPAREGYVPRPGKRLVAA